MIHFNLDLFYDIYNTITEHNQRQTHYILLISNYFGSEWKSSFINSSASSLIMIYMLFIITYGKTEVFAIIDWIFHESDFKRLFMTSFKYGLIFLKYFSDDSVLFLSPLLLHSR